MAWTNNSGELGKLRCTVVCAVCVKHSTNGPPKKASVSQSLGRGRGRDALTATPFYRARLDATRLVTFNVTTRVHLM